MQETTKASNDVERQQIEADQEVWMQKELLVIRTKFQLVYHLFKRDLNTNIGIQGVGHYRQILEDMGNLLMMTALLPAKIATRQSSEDKDEITREIITPTAINGFPPPMVDENKKLRYWKRCKKVIPWTLLFGAVYVVVFEIFSGLI